MAYGPLDDWDSADCISCGDCASEIRGTIYDTYCHWCARHYDAGVIGGIMDLVVAIRGDSSGSS